MKNKEIRKLVKPEIRTEGDSIKVSGYAATFDDVTSIGGYFDEVIERGAFKDAIKRDDVRFLINHDGLPLARTASGTLTLKEDSKGLYMETELNMSDPDVQRIVPKMERGDLNEMSFAFMPTVEEWDESGDTPLRKIKEAELFDVAIVTYPAYNSTEIGLRSLEDAQKPKKNYRLNRLKTRQAESGM
tara:strand:- start:231 stop:791 length:561 start_codon:yes stop_codon:yes gene_type:complete